MKALPARSLQWGYAALRPVHRGPRGLPRQTRFPAPRRGATRFPAGVRAGRERFAWYSWRQGCVGIATDSSQKAGIKKLSVRKFAAVSGTVVGTPSLVDPGAKLLRSTAGPFRGRRGAPSLPRVDCPTACTLNLNPAKSSSSAGMPPTGKSSCRWWMRAKCRIWPGCSKKASAGIWPRSSQRSARCCGLRSLPKNGHQQGVSAAGAPR